MYHVVSPAIEIATAYILVNDLYREMKSLRNAEIIAKIMNLRPFGGPSVTGCQIMFRKSLDAPHNRHKKAIIYQVLTILITPKLRVVVP